jgi:hypothetical protein
VHLNYLAEERIENSQDAQHELAGNAKTRFLVGRLESLFGELPGGYQSGTSDVPRFALRK